MTVHTAVRGLYIPMITPFEEVDGQPVSGSKLKQLIDYLINEQGADGLIPVGTTGESTSLDHDEKQFVIEQTVLHVAGRVKVFAGTGTANTKDTIEMTQFAEKVGADGVLVVAPYYIRPDQEGIFQHLKAVAQSTSLPIIVYNIPVRTGRNMEVSTILRLAEINNIVAIKDTAGDLVHTMDLLEGRRTLGGKPFSVLTGEDIHVFTNLCLGGDGAISATAHVVGQELQSMMSRFHSGDLTGARDVHYRIKKLLQLLFAAPNPAGIKTALDLMGTGLGGKVRLPIVMPDQAVVSALRSELLSLGKASAK